MKTKDIKTVCAPCGISANVLTCLRKYKRSPKKVAFSVSTYHEGYCDVCGDKTYVTEVRDFFYPDFNLLLLQMGRVIECDWCEGLGERTVSVETDNGGGEIVQEECEVCHGRGVVDKK